MLEEGDRMTEVLIQKEKLEMEREEIEESADKDEGRLLEIDDNLKDHVVVHLGRLLGCASRSSNCPTVHPL